MTFRLRQYSLDKCGALFEAHGIDLDVPSELTDGDFERPGIPLGDRRRIQAKSSGDGLPV